MKQSLALIRSTAKASAVLYSGFLAIAAATTNAETVTIGTHVFEIDTDGIVQAGNFAVNLTGGSSAAASRVLTASGNAVADETVTIGSTVYTFKASVAGAYQVQVGATASDSLDNLIAAINLASGVGTKYGTGTAIHPTVSAAKTSASTLTVTAKIKGAQANAIATTETGTNLAWAGATLAGGVSPTAAETIAGLVAAINGSNFITGLAADAATGGIVVQGRSFRGPPTTTETLAGGGNQWDNTTMTGYDTGGAVPNVAFMVKRIVTAAENTANRMTFGFDQPLEVYTLTVRSAAGAVKAFDGTVTQEGLSIVLADTGAVNLATGDVVILVGAI